MVLLASCSFFLVLDKMLPEFAEFRLDDPQKLPDFTGTLFDGQRTKAHLQAVEQGGQGGRAGDDDPVFALQQIAEPRPAQHLGIQAPRPAGT